MFGAPRPSPSPDFSVVEVQDKVNLLSSCSATFLGTGNVCPARPGLSAQMMVPSGSHTLMCAIPPSLSRLFIRVVKRLTAPGRSSRNPWVTWGAAMARAKVSPRTSASCNACWLDSLLATPKVAIPTMSRATAHRPTN